MRCVDTERLSVAAAGRPLELGHHALELGWAQPLWGWYLGRKVTQGSSQARNPGLWDAIPLGLIRTALTIIHNLAGIEAARKLRGTEGEGD